MSTAGMGQHGDPCTVCQGKGWRLQRPSWPHARPQDYREIDCSNCEGHGFLARCTGCQRLDSVGPKGHWHPQLCWTCFNIATAASASR